MVQERGTDRRETIDELLKKMPPEELLKRVPPEERLKGLSADELLAALSPEALDKRDTAILSGAGFQVPESDVAK